jgi:drug/metabolite transporter (DMT)-like permease
MNRTSRAKVPPQGVIIGALVLIQILFGVNYAVSKVIVGNVPPLAWASFRIIVASLVMLSVTLALGRPHPKDGKKFFIPLIGFALLGSIINQTAFLVGLKYTTATNSAILNSLIPVFTLLLVTIRGIEPLTPKRLVGFGLALAGVLVIRQVEKLHLGDETAFGDLLTILNCFSYACFLTFGKKFMETHDRMWTTTWLFIYGSVGITLLAIPEWMSFTMPVITPTMAGAMVFSILGATLLTYFLNVWTLAHVKSSQVAIFIYLQPVVGAAVAWLWLNEVLTARTVISSTLIFFGMLLAIGVRRDTISARLKRWWRGTPSEPTDGTYS